MSSPAYAPKASRPYAIVRGPKWENRTAGYIREQMSASTGEKKCVFCNLNLEEETILSDTKNAHVLGTKYPYFPQHLLFVPKEHFASISEAPVDVIADLMRVFGALQKISSGMILFGNEGLLGGQTIKHMHAHGVPSQAPDIGTSRLVHPNLVFNDILSAFLIQNACCEYTYECPHRIQQEINPSNPREISRFIKAAFGALEAVFSAAKRNMYGFEIPDIYKHGKKSPYPTFVISKLLKERTRDELGFNWCLRMHEGKTVFELLPRATVINNEQERQGIGGYEPFAGMTAVRSGLSEPEAIVWKAQEAEFYAAVRQTLALSA